MKRRLYLGFMALLLGSTLTSCYRSNCEVWEDTKTCGRYMGKGVRSLFGQHLDSREHANYYEQWDDTLAQGGSKIRESEFVPLSDVSSQNLDLNEYPLSKESPGDPGSPLPGIEGFSKPTGALAELFNNFASRQIITRLKAAKILPLSMRLPATLLIIRPPIYS